MTSKECPGCENKFKPFYKEQIYCGRCRDGKNNYDRDAGELSYKAYPEEE